MQQNLHKFSRSSQIFSSSTNHMWKVWTKFALSFPSFTPTPHETAGIRYIRNNHMKMEFISWKNLKYRCFYKIFSNSHCTFYVTIRSLAQDVTRLLWIVFGIPMALKIPTSCLAQRILGTVSIWTATEKNSME